MAQGPSQSGRSHGSQSSASWSNAIEDMAEFGFQERDSNERKRVEQRLLKRQRRRQRKITESGIDYDLTSVGYSGDN